MADDDGQVRGKTLEVVLQFLDEDGDVLIKEEDTANNQTEEEEEPEENNNADPEQEDSSPSDYEFSLREENIRLKSRLEQAKEGMSTTEKQCKKAKDELEKEKKFGDKANSTICSLMQEKQQLMERLKSTQPVNVHHEGVQEVVRKLEHEIQVLEERLDIQRKRYQQEHLVMYEDLKEERSKRQEWKQTYLKSQVAVMAFRRKLLAMKDRVSEEDAKNLSKCLELVFHEPDGRLKQDLISKSEEACVEGKSKYAAHINNTYKSSTTTTREGLQVKELPEIPPSTPRMSKDMDKEVQDYINARLPPTNEEVSSVKQHSTEVARNESSSTPTVFIMDDENELIDPAVTAENAHLKDDFNVKLPHMGDANKKTSCASQNYDLAGNKHHNHSLPTSQQQQQQRQSQDSNPQYKHWHHYSIDNPGHNPGRKLETLLATRLEGVAASGEPNKKSLVSTLQRLEDASYKSKFSKYNHGSNDQLELNVNNTKFLELNFDRSFMKTDYNKPAPLKLPKLLPQKNGIRNEVTDTTANKKFEMKKLYCLTCDMDVPNRSCGHTTIIVQEKEREFPCPTCARVFTNRSHLKRHNMIHSGEKPFHCTYCEKRFNRKSHLSRHLLTHTGEKPFKCPTCDKGFADNSDLKRHKQIHEVSPSLVPILPKEQMDSVNSLSPLSPVTQITQVTSVNDITNTTSPCTTSLHPTSVQLNVPVAIAPATIKPSMTMSLKKDVRYCCNKCDKQFSRKSHLTRHKLSHELVKIYCDCGRLFRQNAHFQAHYPACKRKRENIEARYLAHGDTKLRRIEPRPEPGTGMGVPLSESNHHLLSPDSLSISNIKSVNDFRAHLAAKFNEGASIVNMKQGINDVQVKEEQMDYYEAQQLDFTDDTSQVHVATENSAQHNNTGIAQYSTMEILSQVATDELTRAQRIPAGEELAEQASNYKNSEATVINEVIVKQEQAAIEVEYSNACENSTNSAKAIPSETIPSNNDLCLQNSTTATLLCQRLTQKSGTLVSTQLRGDDSEQFFVVPSDVLANQYIHKSNNIEQELAAAYKMNDDNINEQTIQKMPDINFNIIVKNGSSKHSTDDLGSASLPSLPSEVPPLLNE